MARSNGIQLGPRKGLVQPVLPALPLIPKAKKESVKPEEEDNSGENGVAPEIVAATDAEPAPQATSNALEDNSDERPGLKVMSKSTDVVLASEEAAHSSSSTDQGTPTTEQTHDDVAPDDKASPEHSISPTATEPVEVLAGVGVAGIATGAEVPSPTEALNKSPLTSAPLTPPAAEAHLPQTPSEKIIGEVVNGSPPAAHTAPEAVTGQVEQKPLISHSNQPSISNSSIQLTPRYSISMPFSPDGYARSQYQLPTNGTYQMSPHELTNGHGANADGTNAANGAFPSFTGTLTVPTISHHIRSLQYLPDWFDAELCVYFSQDPKPAIYRSAHSLVLIRSERLRNFIYPQRASPYPYYVINLAPARPIDSNAFDAALKFVYEDSVLSADRLLPPTGLDKTGKMRALDYIVSYLISGLELGLEPVTTRALDLIGRLLDWDIAELALKEAVVLRSASVPEVNPHVPRDAAAAVKSVIQHIFNLIILHLDLKHFKVDTIATSTDVTSRFAHLESGRGNINPALANMVFGSMPASGMPAMSLSSDTVASIIMLNIDFEDLSLLFDGMKKVHGNDSIRVIGDIVDERERRRLNILNNRSIPNKQRMANSAAWDIVGRREYLIDGQLRQDHVGFTLPPKRGNLV